MYYSRDIKPKASAAPKTDVWRLARVRNSGPDVLASTASQACRAGR